MNRNSIRLFCFLLLLTISRFSLAQTTDNRPVQVTPVLQPPFSLHFTDYSTNPQLLKVYLLLKDLTKTHIDIYLNLRLQGPGVLIQTRPDFRPSTPFTLQAGVPHILSGPELSAYFQPNALEVQGLDDAILTQGGKLPEGLYTITFEAFEWDRQRESVSNQGTSLLTVFLNYPPLLTFPARDSEVPFQNLPNVLFQWVGRNTGTVAWSGQPLYTFRLWELRDEQDPNVAVQSLIPLYEETTSQSSLVYGPALPPLQPGMRYAWQVQARDALGQDVYINQGISEVSAFVYGKPVIESIPTDSVTIPAVTVAQVLDPYSYPVQSGNPDTPGSTVQELLTSSVLQNLLTDSTRIPKCNPINIDGSNCVETVQVPLPSGEVQGSLNPGDVVIINQYKVLVTQASGSGGNFSGQGLLIWNFAGATHVPVSFSNLQVVKAFNSATGGCATGGQMTSGGANGALTEQLQAIVNQVSPTGPGSFSGTLGEALVALNQTMSSPNPDKTAIGPLTSAILQGLSRWKEAIRNTYWSSHSTYINPVLQEIDGLITVVNQANQCARTPACGMDQNLLQTTLPARIFIANQQLTELVNLPTDPNGRVAAQVDCQLDIVHLDPTNVRFLTTNQHLLKARGCVGGTIAWSNGTPASTATDGTITWADGEKGQPFVIATTLALLIEPNHETTYTAICQMPSGKVCTYSLNVTIPSPDCPPFTIASSANSFVRGQTITLTATGCDGTISWGSGLGSSSKLKLTPTRSFVAVAYCQKGERLCYSNTIGIELRSTCLEALYVQQEKVIDPGIGKTRRERTLAVLGCETGYLTWQKTGMADATVNGRSFVMTAITGPVSVTVTCTLPGAPLCSPISQTFAEPAEVCKTDLLATYRDNAPVSPAGYTTLFSLLNTPFTLIDETQKRYNITPADAVSVPLLAKDKVYTATFANGCTASKLIPALIYTATWNRYTNGTISALLDPVSRTNDPVTYTADVDASDIQLKLKSACIGKVIWSSSAEPTLRLEAPELILTRRYATVSPAKTLFPNSDSSRVQSLYVPFPSVTTTYSAACVVTTGGNTDVFPVINPKTLIVASNTCLKLTTSTSTLTHGEALTLQAVGCSGTLSWKMNGSLVGTGKTLTHTPVLATTPGSVTYTAQCDNPACTESVTVQLQPTALFVTSPKTVVAIAEAISLTASGCSGGQVVWSTGEEGPIITVRPLAQTTYTATCWVNNANLGQKSVILTVINTAPDPIECPPFSLTANSATVVRCAGQTITFGPKGCPVGSTVTWSDGHVGAYNEPYALVVNTTQAMTATCKTPYGIEAVASLTVVTTEPKLSVSIPTNVYAGVPTTLTAFGCATDCRSEGTYIWHKWNTTEPDQTGSSIQVVLTEETEYKVTCKNQSIRIKIPVQPISCRIETDIKHYSTEASISLKANQCDLNRSIIWMSYENPNGCVSSILAQDVDKIRVPRPATIGGQSCQGYYTVSCYKNGLPCSAAISVNPLNSGGPPLSGTDPTPPQPLGDPCEKLRFDETKTLSSPDAIGYLNSKFCPGQVSWYKDEARSASGLICILSGGDRYAVGTISQSVTFYYECRLKDGYICKGTGTLKPSITSGGRVAAEARVEALGICKPLEDRLLSKDMVLFYDKMLCQLKNLIRTPEDAQTVLSSLQHQLAGTAVVFPNDVSKVLDALMDGDCHKAAQLMAVANGQKTIDEEVFNSTINGQFSKIQNLLTALLGASLQITGEAIQSDPRTIIVSVDASDQNEIDDTQEIIAQVDRRQLVAVAEDRQVHINRLPVTASAQNYFQEINAVWDATNQPAYADYLNNLFTIPISIENKIKQLENKPLIFPDLVQEGTLSRLSEGFLKTFFMNKIKGYSSEATGLKSLYTGPNKTLYETVGAQLLNHFYEKSGTDYFQMKTIADAIYSTSAGNRRINSMIQIVDALFFRKIGNQTKPEDSNPDYYQKDFVPASVWPTKKLDKDWFNSEINTNVFPSFGAMDAISLNNAPPGEGDAERLGLFTIGGTQGVDVRVKSFTPILTQTQRGYSATVIIRYLDTFGVSESDYAKDLGYTNSLGALNYLRFNYRGGVLSQWILQHQYDYSPFTDYLTFIVTMKRTWNAN